MRNIQQSSIYLYIYVDILTYLLRLINILCVLVLFIYVKYTQMLNIKKKKKK